MATIDEVARLFGHTVSGIDVETRLEELTESEQTHHVSDKQDILGRLDAIEGKIGKLSQSTRSREATVNTPTVCAPFGRSREESRERIRDAVESLRDALNGDGDEKDTKNPTPGGQVSEDADQ